MGVTRKIQEKISKLAKGSTFKYEQLADEPREFVAAAKAVERLIAKGVIKRVSTGVFYKPKKSVFGELKPNEEEILKPYLFDKGKRISYITGTSLYNQMGLTTQIPKSIKISSRVKRITVSRGNIKATPVKSYVDVTDSNFHLLELLDALKDFKQIPDLDKSSAIKILSKKLKELTPSETKLLVKSSLAYPPRVRGFLGALLESIEASTDLTALKKSLNPFSEYEYGIESILSTTKNWNVK
ncbi:MAG: hypothetical protein EOM23_03965 [Candidatus Moranbacteria bacterium]|nr:hypothetical protein [Candidatus Moranbacteria bacterium]